MDQLTITKINIAMQQLVDTATDLCQMYQDNPDLNNIQPESFERALPVSLDEWVEELLSAKEDWIRKLRTPLRQYLARAMGGTAASSFAAQIEANPPRKWTETEVINWFVNRRCAFVPTPDIASNIADQINGVNHERA